MPDETRPCTCGGKIRRKNPTGRWPVKCDDCKGGKASKRRNGKRPALVFAADDEPDAVHTTNGAHDAEVNVVGIIEQLELGYTIGTAARYLLEFRDGDELANLLVVRDHVDMAIKQRGGE
jgi:hypothetical protein